MTRLTVALRLLLWLPVAGLAILFFLLHLLARRVIGTVIAAGLCWLCWRSLRHTLLIARSEAPADFMVVGASTAALALAGGLFFVIVVPKLADLDRYNAEARMRSDLTALRIDLHERLKQGGSPPAQLEDLAQLPQ